MRIAVLSDLHLASDSAPCAFRHHPSEFRRFLDHVAANSDQIVLAGDVFDTDLAPVPYGQRRELERARARWKPLLDHLRDLGALWLYGNHDRLLAPQGVPESVTIEACGRRLTVMHGHQFYPLPAVYERVKYPVKWFASRLQASAHTAQLGHLLHAVNDRLSTPAVGPTVTGRGALGWLRDHPDTDFLVCGHEHVTERVDTPHGTYLNSGTCGFDRLDWVVVDLKEGTAEIRDGEN